MKEIKHPWRLLTLVSATGLAVDLLTKHIAAHNLVPGRAVSCIGHFLELILVYNTKMVFSLDFGPVLHALSPYFNLVISVVLIFYYRTLRRSDRLMHWGLALILAGALGNLFDRLFHAKQGVVDFIKVDAGFPPFNPWPVFNAADAWVTIGVGFLILSFILEDLRKKRAAATPAETGGESSAGGTSSEG